MNGQRSGHAGHRLQRLLNPSTVAVVGATDRLGAFTGDTIHNLLRYEYPGRVFPVNPKRSSVMGLPCFASLHDLPAPPDCVVVSVAADRVLEVLAECAAVGVDSAVVTASGFGEGGAGSRGVARRRLLDEFLAAHPMALLGPSTTGLINLFDRFVPRAATNLLPPEAVRPGAVAVISQSGACNNIVFNRAQDQGVGVGLAVATGLQATITVWDVADYALRDERVSVLSLLIEDLGRPEEWRPILDSARRTGRSVVLCKLGRSTRGAEALLTHSGAIAGSWRAQEQALRDAGALLVDDLDQLWEVAALCAAWGPPTRSVRLGAIAMSGGEGALISDLAERTGLELPDVTADFEAVVANHLTLTRGANPFDPSGEVLGRPHVLEPILDAFIGQPAIDRVLIAWHVLDDNVLVDAWPALQALFERYRDRLVLTGWPVAALSRWQELRTPDGPPFLSGSHRAVAAIACYSQGVPASRPDDPATAVPHSSMPVTVGVSYQEVRELLAGMGVEFGRQMSVCTPEQAVDAGDVLGWPLVLKANVDSTVHKSAAGLVHVGLRDDAAVRAAWESLRATCEGRLSSFMVEEHILGEIEVFLGVRVDPDVGPVLLFGSGGSAVEYLGDVVLGPARLSAVDDLVRRSAVGRFLLERAVDCVPQLRAMCAALVTLGQDGRVESAELNPVIVDLRTRRARAVDARINLAVAGRGTVRDAPR